MIETYSENDNPSQTAISDFQINIYIQVKLLKDYPVTKYTLEHSGNDDLPGGGVVGGGVVTTGGLVCVGVRVVFVPSSGILPLFLHE